MISSFRDLRVWQQGMDLVEQIYGVSRDFPKHEIYGLSSQMRRAAVSIPANIAEGHIRRQPRAYLNYVSIALGSLEIPGFASGAEPDWMTLEPMQHRMATNEERMLQ